MPVWNTAKNIKRGSSQVIKMLRGGNSPWAAYNAATGGTVTDVANYNGTGETWRVHRFTSNGNFSVTRAVGVFPFRVLVIGGGGGGTYNYGGGGGSGTGGRWSINDSMEIPVASYPVVVGGGGGGGNTNRGGNGGTSTAFGLTGPGGGGAPYPSNGSPLGVNSYSDITGESVLYGWNPWRGAYQTRGIASGGGGGVNVGNWGFGGGGGAVIVAYRIA